MKCDHIECGSVEKVWLPFIVNDKQLGLKSHSFCIRCGMVKNMGSDRARSNGYYLNILSNIEKHFEIPGAKVRMRLIAKELEKLEDFDDIYSMSRFSQDKTFVNIIKKYLNLPDRTIRSFL